MNYVYNSQEIIAIIPARSGSKGIKNKNIKDVKGFPLIAYSIAAGKQADTVSRVIVSTDSKDYADIAVKYGAEVPFLRPSDISKSDSKDIEYLQHALSEIFRSEGEVPGYVVLLRPTTPMRDPLIIDKAVQLIKENRNATAVVSVHLLEECPYKWMTISDKGYLESPFTELEPDDVNLPRQSFKKVYEPDGYVDVLKSRVILEDGLVYGKMAVPLFVEGEAIDIDSFSDLKRVKDSHIESGALYKYLSRLGESCL